MARLPIANYAAEEALFTDLVSSDNEPSILLLQGESGSGKSHLIQHLLKSAPENPSAFLKLQSRSEAIPALFTMTGMKLGWQRFPNFTHTVAVLQEQPGQETDPVWQLGMHRHLAEVGKLGDIDSRLSRYQLLTDAWVADTMQFETPMLLAIDAYEKASSTFDRWFSRDFLYGVANSGRVRVLVGGQKTPELQEGWSFCATLRELKGVADAEAWLVWAAEAGYQVPSLEYLAGAVVALKGNPSQIAAFIKAQFPYSEASVEPAKSVSARRRLIRRNMVEAFNLDQLKDICFDLEINHEHLPGHTQLKSFVRELIAYVGRIGRLDELIRICQEERPHLRWAG